MWKKKSRPFVYVHHHLCIIISGRGCDGKEWIADWIWSSLRFNCWFATLEYTDDSMAIGFDVFLHYCLRTCWIPGMWQRIESPAYINLYRTTTWEYIFVKSKLRIALAFIKVRRKEKYLSSTFFKKIKSSIWKHWNKTFFMLFNILRSKNPREI